MKHSHLLLLLVLFLNSFAFTPRVWARLIQTNKLAGENNIDLQLNEKDQVISVKSSGGRPIVGMELFNLQELVRDAGRFIKIEVYKNTSGNREFVGAFNYKIKARARSRKFRLPLPQFNNQSENYEFNVFDTDGVLRARFAHSFSAAELIARPDDGKDSLEDGVNVDPSLLESIVRSISVRTVNSTKLAGIEKDVNGKYVINIPNGRNLGSIKGKNVSSLKINAFGTLEERVMYDKKKKGFVFLDHENQLVYIKGKGKGKWSNPIPLSGEGGMNFDLESLADNSIGLDKIAGGDKIIDLLNNSSSGPGEPGPAGPAGPQGERGATGLTGPTGPPVDLSNVPGDITVQGAFKTNNVDDKTISLNIDQANVTGALLGTVASQTVPVIRFLSNSEATWTLTVPQDLIKTNASHSNLKLKLFWSPSNSLGHSIDWRVRYGSFGIGDTLAGTSFSTLNKTQTAPAVTLGMTSTEFEIPVSALKETLIIKLARVDANDVKPNLSGVEIDYPALSLEKI